MRANSILTADADDAAPDVVIGLQPIPRLLLTAPQAAAALSISERKLSELTACGAVRSVAVGRARRYSVHALSEYIAANETPAAEGHVTRGVA